MKTTTIIILSLIISNSLFSQTDNNNQNKRETWYEAQPKGMSFIGQGTYSRTVIIKNDTVIYKASVAPFWMSNEITNKEFREFISALSLTPNDSLCWINYNSNNNQSTNNKSHSCISYSDASKNLIDTTIFKNENTRYKNYFSNKEFDDYPIVGVSYNGAKFYCMWKTQIEIEKLKKDGKTPYMNDYRVPVEEEWYYAASMPMLKEKTNNNNLQKVNSGERSKNSLYHFSDNVSEWTSTNSDNELNNSNVVLGGSWKDNADVNNRFSLDRNSKNNYVGFRIVRTYISNIKN
ncbi:MAG: SUMF1/EgtB/PvdO family nonheme iron enzyme [Bacteroidia bacterium]|nr:SUMF1/EgtB/PvdO family nonheme iron enzyme [Bacteroidia bacterium]